MREFLFNNSAFPIVSDVAEAGDAFHQDNVRAVVLRHSVYSSLIQDIADHGSIVAQDRPDLADQYKILDTGSKRQNYAGRTTYNEIYAQDMMDEANQAGIAIRSVYAQNLQRALRFMYLSVKGVFCKLADIEPHQCHVRVFYLFTPKGGEGRSPYLHVDNTVFTGHVRLALAPLEIRMKDLTSQQWSYLDSSGAHRDLDKFERGLFLEGTRTEDSSLYQATCVGDFMMQRGQKNLDISDPSVQRKLCPHRSSPSIKDQGQACVLMVPSLL
jgi:hypothetical protein